MKVTHAYSFLVHPGRGEEAQPRIGGASIQPVSEVGMMLGAAFSRSMTDCSLDIVFVAATDGSQNNKARVCLLSLLTNPSLEKAREVAELLQKATTRRSGLGLFFVLIGKDEDTKAVRLYLARFPADNGITAEEYEDGLKVELLEQVFMKNAYAYKAVVYEDTDMAAGFLGGRAIDKQVSSKDTGISGYWIKEFLCSDFKTTSGLGTRRFAKALRNTIETSSNIEIKHELTALATLARNFDKKVISIDKISKTFNLSEAAASELTLTLQRPEYAFSKFTFSSAEFSKHIRFRQLHLSNGAFLTASARKFDEVFSRYDDPEQKVTTFSTVGKVIDESLTKRTK